MNPLPREICPTGVKIERRSLDFSMAKSRSLAMKVQLAWKMRSSVPRIVHVSLSLNDKWAAVKICWPSIKTPDPWSLRPSIRNTLSSHSSTTRWTPKPSKDLWTFNMIYGQLCQSPSSRLKRPPLSKFFVGTAEFVVGAAAGFGFEAHWLGRGWSDVLK